SDPRSGRAWGRLGQVLLANEFFPEGQFCLARAEEFDPDEPRWPYLLAGINSATNPDTEAKLRRAVELCDPSILAPRLRLADWLLGRGRFEEAEAEFRRSLAAADNPWARVGLARTALERGDAQAALDVIDPPGWPPTARAILPRAYHSLRA